MTKTITHIRAEFDALKPGIAEGFKTRTRATWERLVERYGQPGVRKLAHSFSSDGGAYRQLSGLLSVAKGANMFTGELSISKAALERRATDYADASVDGFTAKLERKLGDLTDVELKYVSAGRGEFVITGKLGDRKVRVEQNVTFNVSPKGTLFNQWPARIYVDGKFTSEAAFKKLPR